MNEIPPHLMVALARADEQKNDTMPRRIIALAGRKEAGKSELSAICEEFGFEICNFAGAMKSLVSEYLHITPEQLNRDKELPQAFVIDAAFLAYKLDCEMEEVSKILGNIQFSSIRNALQFIGTQLIRELRPTWHIEQVQKKIKEYPDTNFIIDDLRFRNELGFLHSIGAECWYIIRPANFNISNHQSEVDVSWADFGDNVILNNIPLNRFRSKWRKYLEEILHKPLLTHETYFKLNGIHTKQEFRKWLTHNIQKYSTTKISERIGCSRDKIAWWCDRLLVPISREKYFYDPTSFLSPSEEASYCAGLLASDGCIKFSPQKNCALISFDNMDRELVDSLRQYMKSTRPISQRSHRISRRTIYGFDCNNPYVLQNLKWWNIKPRKSQREEIPDIIRDNEACLKQWVVGMIDGDGSIFLTKQGTLGLTILASKEIIEFLEKFIPFSGAKYENVKNTKLCELRWNNYKAVDVRNWLSPRTYLRRKWFKIDAFLKIGTKRRTALPTFNGKLI